MISKENEQYKITFKYNQKNNIPEIHIKSIVGAGNSVVQTRYNVLNNDGAVIDTRLINDDIAKLILDRVLEKGVTEAFNFYEHEVGESACSEKKVVLAPADIRHSMTKKEKSFTATGVKLLHHWPIFKKMSETGYGSIIRATMTNHQRCTSRCPYCSTISRNKNDSISLSEAKEFVTKLYFDQAEWNKKNYNEYNQLYKKQTGSDIRLRGLILSGGGQPNLWPNFSEFVTWLSGLDLDLGLITNGFPKHIDEEVYDNFKWIRLSITPEDASPFYPNGKFDQQYIPSTIIRNPDITFGVSCVYGYWTNEDFLKRLHSACEKWSVEYCRMLADCNLTRLSQLAAHKDLAERLYSLGFINEVGEPLGKIFHQFKYHGTKDRGGILWDKGQCFLQTYNVFWDTTGHEDDGYSYCYPCDSITVLAEEQSSGRVKSPTRRFESEKWGTVKSIEVEKLFTEKVKPFFDPRVLCSACLFMNNNDMVKSLLECDDLGEVELPVGLDHINFP